MKALKTKVLLSAFVLLFALVATIGSTFAWFTVATTVNVDPMTLNIQSQDSLLIRLANRDGSVNEANKDLFDADQYKSFVSTSEILAYYPLAGWRLTPVTAVKGDYTGVDGSVLNALNAPTNPLRPLTAIDLAAGSSVDVNSATGKVIEINFYLWNQDLLNNREIVLQDLSINSNATTVANEVVDAVRLTVQRRGVVSNLEANLPKTAQVLTSETLFPAHIFGRTKDYGFVFTNSNPAYYFDFQAGDPDIGYYTESGSNPDFTYTLNGFNKISDLTRGYNGEGSAAPVTTNWNSTFYQSVEGVGIVGGATGTKGDATTVFSLPANTPTFVTVRIFVEGWAANTTNNIIASQFNISFKFSIKTVA